MPLGLAPPVDAVSYLGGSRPGGQQSAAVDEYLKAILRATKELESEGIDTERLLTLFDVSLQSTKKIEKADIVVGVGAGAGAAPVLVTRKVDPNVTHPYRQKEVIERLASAHGGKVTTHVFQAIVWQHQLKTQDAMCWQDKSSGLVKWSTEVIAFVKGLSAKDLEAAKRGYAAYLRKRRSSRAA